MWAPSGAGLHYLIDGKQLLCFGPHLVPVVVYGGIAVLADVLGWVRSAVRAVVRAVVRVARLACVPES